MTVYHGATVVLKLSRLAAEGKIVKEYLGLLDGSGDEQTFYTANFPVTTSVGVTTDTETDVDVYTRPAAGGETFTELDDDGSDFDITGATGAVVVEEAANQAGDAGKFLSISYYTTADVSRGQGATIEFNRDLQSIHELGSDAPAELAAGQYEISGTIEALHTTRDILGKVLGIEDFYKTLASFSMYLYPNGNTAGQPYIKVGSATFHDGDLKAGLKTILANNLKFKGTALSIGTV